MAGVKKRAKKNRILEDESPPQAHADDDNWLEMIEERAKRSGKTVDEVIAEDEESLSCITIDDVMWTGGRERDEPGKWAELDRMLQSELSDRRPLERVVLAIIDAHPEFSPPAAADLKGKDIREYRLEQAMHFLTGRSPNAGRPPKADYEQICTQAATRYFKQTYLRHANDQDTSLSKIFRDLLFPSGIGDLDHKAVDDRISPYRDYFKKNKGCLMLKVTGAVFGSAGAGRGTTTISSIDAGGCSFQSVILMRTGDTGPIGGYCLGINHQQSSSVSGHSLLSRNALWKLSSATFSLRKK